MSKITLNLKHFNGDFNLRTSDVISLQLKLNEAGLNSGRQLLSIARSNSFSKKTRQFQTMLFFFKM